MLIAFVNKEETIKLKMMLSIKFEMKYPGEAKRILDMEIQIDKKAWKSEIESKLLYGKWYFKIL